MVRASAFAWIALVLSGSSAFAQVPNDPKAPPEIVVKQRNDKNGAGNRLDLKLYLQDKNAPGETKPANGPAGKPDTMMTFLKGSEGTVAGQPAYIYSEARQAKVAEPSLAKMVAYIGGKDADVSHYSAAEKDAAMKLYAPLVNIAGVRCRGNKNPGAEERKALRGAESYLEKMLAEAAGQCRKTASSKLDCDAKPPECPR